MLPKKFLESRQRPSHIQAAVGGDAPFRSLGLEEVGRDAASGEVRVQIDPRYFRPTEVEFLLGDSTKAQKALGWKPEVSFDQLVRRMVQEDIKEARRDHLIEKEGYQAYHHFE
ncbi:MAG: GDP-mannose 4,6-dehydratase [Desulfococcaceae bacterium]